MLDGISLIEEVFIDCGTSTLGARKARRRVETPRQSAARPDQEIHEQGDHQSG